MENKKYEIGEKNEWEIRAVHDNPVSYAYMKGIPDELASVFFKAEDKYEDTVFSSTKGKLLEVGAGLGRWSHRLEEKGKEIVRTDISHNALKENVSENNFPRVCCSIDALPFKNDYFDSLFWVNVISALNDREKQDRALNEIVRVIKVDGNVVFIEFTVPGIIKLLFNSLYKKVVKREPFVKERLSVLYDKCDLVIKKDKKLFASTYLGILVWKVFNNSKILKPVLLISRIIDKLLFVFFDTYPVYVFRKK